MADTITLENILDNISALIGDTPVSTQLSAVLNYMPSKEYISENYVSRAEYETLRADFEKLAALIGDTSVSEQISAAINRK